MKNPIMTPAEHMSVTENAGEYAYRLADTADELIEYANIDGIAFCEIVSAYVKTVRAHIAISGEKLTFCCRAAIIERLKRYGRRIAHEALPYVEYVHADIEAFSTIAAAYADIALLLHELEKEGEHDEENAEPAGICD